MYTYIHTHIHLIELWRHTFTYVYTYIHTHIHIPDRSEATHIYIHTHIYTYMHTHTYIPDRSQAAGSSDTHLYTYTHTYIHTYTHTYIHTYIHIPDRFQAADSSDTQGSSCQAIPIGTWEADTSSCLCSLCSVVVKNTFMCVERHVRIRHKFMFM